MIHNIYTTLLHQMEREMQSQSPLSPVHFMSDPSTRAFHEVDSADGSDDAYHRRATHSIAMADGPESEHVTCNSVNARPSSEPCTSQPLSPTTAKTPPATVPAEPTHTESNNHNPTNTTTQRNRTDEGEDATTKETSLCTSNTTTNTSITTTATAASSHPFFHIMSETSTLATATLPPRRESVRQRLQRRRNSLRAMDGAVVVSHAESTRPRLLRPAQSMSPPRSCSAGVMDAPFSTSTTMSSEWSLVTSLDEMALPATPSPSAAVAQGLLTGTQNSATVAVSHTHSGALVHAAADPVTPWAGRSMSTQQQQQQQQSYAHMRSTHAGHITCVRPMNIPPPPPPPPLLCLPTCYYRPCAPR